jgi:hypothetical protein
VCECNSTSRSHLRLVCRGRTSRSVPVLITVLVGVYETGTPSNELFMDNAVQGRFGLNSHLCSNGINWVH